MNTSEAIRARRSIRKYQKGAIIPKEHIEQMLEAAMMAPSACNRRPWEFVVVQKPEVQEGVCDGFWPQDCGAAIENLLLQAGELGYGTCWCGCYPAMKRAEGLQKVLDVTSIPLAVVAVGKADEAPDARGFYDPSRVMWIL